MRAPSPAAQDEALHWTHYVYRRVAKLILHSSLMPTMTPRSFLDHPSNSVSVTLLLLSELRTVAAVGGGRGGSGPERVTPPPARKV